VMAKTSTVLKCPEILFYHASKIASGHLKWCRSLSITVLF